MISASLFAVALSQASTPSQEVAMKAFYYKEVTNQVRGRAEIYPLSNWVMRFMFPKTMEADLVSELKDGFKVFVRDSQRARPIRGISTGSPIAEISAGRTDFICKTIPSARDISEVAGATIFTWWDDRTEIGIVGDRGSSSASEFLAAIYLGIPQRRQELGTLGNAHHQRNQESPVPMPMRTMPSKFTAVIEGKSKKYTIEFKLDAGVNYKSLEPTMIFKSGTGAEVQDLSADTKINEWNFYNDSKGTYAPKVKIEG